MKPTLVRAFGPGLLAAAAVASLAAVTAEGQPSTIDLSAAGTRAPWHACVGGTIGRDGEVWVIVRPAGSSDYFVQPRVTTNGRTYRATLYIGEDRREHNGLRFEVAAVLDPRARLHEGDVLSDWPPAAARSRVVEILRDDGAPSGCLAPADVAAAAGPAAEEADIAAAPTPGPESPPAPVASAENRPERSRSWPFEPGLALVAAGVLLLGLMAAVCGRTGSILARLEQAVSRCWTWASKEARSCGAMSAGVSARATRAAGWLVRILWQSNAARPRTIHGVIHHATAVAILLPGCALALLVDTLAILSGLELVFPPLQLVGQPSALFVAAAAPAAGPAAVAAASGLVHAVFVAWTVIAAHPLGLMALGLSAIQGVMGCLLLWPLDAVQAIAKRPLALLRERPGAVAAFVGLTLALAILAAIRGFETSPAEVPGWVAAATAASIAISMPITMAYGLHHLVESLEVVAVPLAAAAGTLLAGGAAFAVVAACVAALVAGACAVAAALALYTLLVIVVWQVFWAAELTVSFLKILLARGGAPAGARTSPVRAAARVTAMLVVLVLIPGAAAAGAWRDSTAATPAPPSAARHDPARPYRCWALLIDTTQSVVAEQFDKAKALLRRLVDADVGPNDLVWLIEVADTPSGAALFAMPRGEAYRSTRQEALDGLREAKDALHSRIAGLRQTAMRTALANQVELVLNVLAGHPRATQATVVIVSDFVEDNAREERVAPPPARPRLSARGARVALVVARPQRQYLARLHFSEADLVDAVRNRWAAYFEALGARPTLTVLDALPVH